VNRGSAAAAKTALALASEGRQLGQGRLYNPLQGARRLQAPTLPEGQLLYAVGDIHGRSDLLADLLAKIAADAADAADAAESGLARRTLVFLGDYVDRGPDSRGVVETLISSLPQGFDAYVLKGNHEAMLLDFLRNPSYLELWLANGGDATLRSYGVNVDGLHRKRAPAETWREAFAAALPYSHRRFLEDLNLMVSFGDYLFVHAGVKPGVPLDAQDPGDLVWIRDEFLHSKETFGKMVVHGHTPVHAAEVCDNRIDIDTGAVFSGRLTALRLEGCTRRFLQT
jgi:serine/threonine protein phosphatase 1